MPALEKRGTWSIRTLCSFACAVALASAGGGMALANEGVQAGNDYFETLPGTEVDLSGIGLGVIPLQGLPFGGCIGNADTIVKRLDSASTPVDTVEIEIIALELKSVAPVDLSPLGGPFLGVLADLYTTINTGGVSGVPVYDALSPSVGRMQIRHEFADGGTFDSCFGDPDDPGTCAGLGVSGGGVYADAIFVIPGSDPNNVANLYLSLPAPRISLYTQNSTWVHDSVVEPTGSGGPPGGCGPSGAQPRNSKITDIAHNGPHLVRAVLYTMAVPALRGSGLGIMLVAIAGLGTLALVRRSGSRDLN